MIHVPTDTMFSSNINGIAIKILKLILILICLLGSAYTSIDSIQKYFDYETVTQSVMTNEPKIFENPVISYLIQISDCIPRSNRRVILNSLPPNLIIGKCPNLSDVAREISYLTLSDYETIILRKNSTEFNDFMKHNVTVHVINLWVYYRLHLPKIVYKYEKFHQNHSLEYFGAIKSLTSPYYFKESKFIFDTILEPKYIGEAHILIGSTLYSFKKMDYFYSNKLAEHYRGASDLTIFKFKRLPKPFKSNSKNYGGEDFLTKSGCYERCINSFYLELYNKSSPYYIITKESKFKVAFNILNVNETLKRSGGEKCSQPECDEIYYSPSLVSYSVHVTIPHLKRQVLELHFQKTTIVELLNKIFGNAGYWFGISIITVLVPFS